MLKTYQINLNKSKQELHKQIANKLYGKGAKNKSKRLDLIMGIPASGKTKKFVEPLQKKHGSLTIDCDAVKELLPDNKTDKAIHEDSSYIAEQLILGEALKNGDNVVLTKIGKTKSKLEDLIKRCAKHKYETHLHFVEIPTSVAVERAEHRYKSGKHDYTDPKYITDDVDGKPLKNYNEIKNMPEITSYGKYNNNVKEEENPILLEASDNYEVIHV